MLDGHAPRGNNHSGVLWNLLPTYIDYLLSSECKRGNDYDLVWFDWTLVLLQELCILSCECLDYNAAGITNKRAS